MKLAMVLQRRCSKDGRREKQATIKPTQPVVVIGLARSVSTFISRPATFHGRSVSSSMSLPEKCLNFALQTSYAVQCNQTKNSRRTSDFYYNLTKLLFFALQYQGWNHDCNLRYHWNHTSKAEPPPSFRHVELFFFRAPSELRTLSTTPDWDVSC